MSSLDDAINESIKSDEMTEKEVDFIDLQTITFNTNSVVYTLLGKTDIIFNAMSAKTKSNTLFPKAKTNNADRRSEVRHFPLEEFVESAYRAEKKLNFPTLIYMPGSAFRKAICTAALDIKGITKTQVQRLCWINETDIPIYGIPELRMDVVKQAGVGKAPDIRTRATIREWCCHLTITYDSSFISNSSINELIHRAGISIGIGDYRQEKGAGSYGQFMAVAYDDPTVEEIKKTGGRRAQRQAFKTPEFYNSETEALFNQWKEDYKIWSAGRKKREEELKGKE